ncbi:MAG: CPBP family intramembrane metalloprotease [Clostridia bacterium]|nr:CPBP family intramembrane metalloprotease [Clostridia bacterium]
MNRIKLLSFFYILFLALLSLSGSLSGILSEIVYILSFALPTALGIYLVRREGREKENLLLSLDKRSFGLMLPTAAPIISLIIITSSLTSLIIYQIFGAQSSIDVGDNLILALVTHAFLPALLEEMLFRYLPLRLYGGEDNATMVVVTSLCFALVHRDFFVIPYAFLAGALFIIIDIILGSVWPSVILHAVNNTLSVLMIFYSREPIFNYAFYAVLVILTVISLAVIIAKREEYIGEIKKAFSGNRVRLTSEILYLAVPTLILAALDLAAKIQE